MIIKRTQPTINKTSKKFMKNMQKKKLGVYNYD